MLNDNVAAYFALTCISLPLVHVSPEEQNSQSLEIYKRETLIALERVIIVMTNWTYINLLIDV